MADPLRTILQRADQLLDVLGDASIAPKPRVLQHQGDLITWADEQLATCGFASSPRAKERMLAPRRRGDLDVPKAVELPSGNAKSTTSLEKQTQIASIPTKEASQTWHSVPWSEAPSPVYEVERDVWEDAAARSALPPEREESLAPKEELEENFDAVFDAAMVDTGAPVLASRDADDGVAVSVESWRPNAEELAAMDSADEMEPAVAVMQADKLVAAGDDDEEAEVESSELRAIDLLEPLAARAPENVSLELEVENILDDISIEFDSSDEDLDARVDSDVQQGFDAISLIVSEEVAVTPSEPATPAPTRAGRRPVVSMPSVLPSSQETHARADDTLFDPPSAAPTERLAPPDRKGMLAGLGRMWRSKSDKPNPASQSPAKREKK